MRYKYVTLTLRIVFYSLFLLFYVPLSFGQVVHIPDPNLEQVIREELALPENQEITLVEMRQLHHLNGSNRGITKLTGLEHAINLERLHLWNVWYKSGLRWTNLDISPLQNLTRLERLDLSGNGISDISPLASLTNLQILNLTGNHIEDFSPLSGLLNLEELYLEENWGLDISPLSHLNLTYFGYDKLCEDLPSKQSAIKRIENRRFPSVALWPAWSAIDVTRHDFLWGEFDLRLETRPKYIGIKGVIHDVQDAQKVHERWIEQNPNAVFLFGVSLTFATGTEFPPDSDVWFRDAQGNRVKWVGEDWIEGSGEYTYDIVQPYVQEKLVAQILSVAACGLFDGIAIDGFGPRIIQRVNYPASREEIIVAIGNILRKVRERTPEDFLIIVNSGLSRPERFTEYINGNVMEYGNNSPESYTHEELEAKDEALLWNEKNLRYPQINWVEGELISVEPPDSLNNRRWVRVHTTRALTLSNGYVQVYHRPTIVSVTEKGGKEKMPWYEFWDADLGRPIGGDETKGQTYNDIDGIFIREFTNGWAVYNRSGKEQEINLIAQTTGVASGTTSFRHVIADLDGEMYLKTGITADLNGDGIVNILDLVIIANGFGEAEPDLNGDGIVNILDLVIVANAF